MRVLQTVYNLYVFILLLFYFIIIDEFEFDDLKYCMLISVLRSISYTPVSAFKHYIAMVASG